MTGSFLYERTRVACDVFYFIFRDSPNILCVHITLSPELADVASGRLLLPVLRRALVPCWVTQRTQAESRIKIEWTRYAANHNDPESEDRTLPNLQEKILATWVRVGGDESDNSRSIIVSWSRAELKSPRWSFPSLPAHLVLMSTDSSLRWRLPGGGRSLRPLSAARRPSSLEGLESNPTCRGI